jgi:hypothetical protein
MKKYSFVLIMLISFSCGTQKNEQTSTYNEKAPLNNVAPGEAAEGWYSLFDGTTMNGWRTFRNLENDSWEVIDGTLHCKPFKDDETNLRADLVSNDQFDNFELAFDWKISPKGNSGVMFRVSEEFEQPYASGPEYQVIDDEGYPGDLQPGQLTGANYDMHAPTATASNAVGEWNTSKIVANENHIEHWLNGELVVEYELDSEEWNQLREKSKWKDFPGYGLTEKGHIALQDHGNEVWFRNIKIKPLATQTP